jgi:hypothetical protein
MFDAIVAPNSFVVGGNLNRYYYRVKGKSVLLPVKFTEVALEAIVPQALRRSVVDKPGCECFNP